jgi:hypothetical protein
MFNKRLFFPLAFAFALLGALGLYLVFGIGGKGVVGLPGLGTGGEPAGTEEATGSGEEEASGWETYTNSQYGYSFKYPTDYTYGACTTKPCGNFVYDELPGHEKGGYVILQGDIAEKGWPNISIVTVPAPSIGLVEWLQANPVYQDSAPDVPNSALGGLIAVKLSTPASPQAYSSEIIFAIKGEYLFEIILLDGGSEEAKSFYELFLSNFQFD